jgi:RND family efflux transporter MFP subunit
MNMNQVEMTDRNKTPEAAGVHSAREEKHSKKTLLAIVVGAAVVAGLLASGILSRVKDSSKLRTVTNEMSVPAVSVVTPKPTAPYQEIILPGNIQPFISSPIYARTDGYLKKWYFDIGTHVKSGELLALIETPEVDQQLAQARATLATAQANLQLAQITMARYQGLLTKHAVAQQDADNAVGTYNADKAMVEADQANVQHYEALVSFEKVYAPFDGIITARNTDIGDLINSGSSAVAKTDLFHVAQTGVLRVYVNVPEEYSQAIKPGATAADVVLAEFPGQKFSGKLVRTSEAINGVTRTLLVEVDVTNPTNTLLSGSYAEVHLRVPETKTLLIPVNALIFRSEHLQVGVVKNGRVTLTDLTPGHDFGAEIEAVAGLHPGDQVIVNPPDSLVNGEEVKVVQTSLPGDSQ